MIAFFWIGISLAQEGCFRKKKSLDDGMRRAIGLTVWLDLLCTYCPCPDLRRPVVENLHEAFERVNQRSTNAVAFGGKSVVSVWKFVFHRLIMDGVVITTVDEEGVFRCQGQLNTIVMYEHIHLVGANILRWTDA